MSQKNVTLLEQENKAKIFEKKPYSPYKVKKYLEKGHEMKNPT
jgi:hypothetical protein